MLFTRTSKNKTAEGLPGGSLSAALKISCRYDYSGKAVFCQSRALWAMPVFKQTFKGAHILIVSRTMGRDQYAAEASVKLCAA